MRIQNLPEAEFVILSAEATLPAESVRAPKASSGLPTVSETTHGWQHRDRSGFRCWKRNE